MMLARIVETSDAVGATRSRTQKTALLAELLGEASAAELPTVVAWLSGEIPQGRLGVGWRTLQAISAVAAPEAGVHVVDVDAAFTALASTSGAGSAARRTAILNELLGAATESEQRFVTGLMTGELRQGALAGVMTDAIASATDQSKALVRRTQMLTGSLSVTAGLAVGGGEEALRAVRLTVGRPVAPMLASPAESMAAGWESLGTDAVVDYKLDGARIQVHRNGDEIAVFTRSLRDVTAQVPDIIEAVAELDCRSAIFDGETLMLGEDGRPRPFQETMSRFGSAAGETAELLRPYFFDCLHLDGIDLIDEPLSRRLAALDAVAPHLRIPSITPLSAEEAEHQLDSSLSAGHEGVMIKSLKSVYAAGRRGKAWQKVKPVHTFDLVVLAAEWGSGRRTGFLSNLHLGAAGPDGPVMVGKTFKGLTDELLAWQTDEFPRHETHRDSYTVYLRPDIVVEIELDGVQRSSRYPGGVALRFARVLGYRPDKSVDEIDTVEGLRALLR